MLQRIGDACCCAVFTIGVLSSALCVLFLFTGVPGPSREFGAPVRAVAHLTPESMAPMREGTCQISGWTKIWTTTSTEYSTSTSCTSQELPVTFTPADGVGSDSQELDLLDLYAVPTTLRELWWPRYLWWPSATKVEASSQATTPRQDKQKERPEDLGFFEVMTQVTLACPPAKQLCPKIKAAYPWLPCKLTLGLQQRDPWDPRPGRGRKDMITIFDPVPCVLYRNNLYRSKDHARVHGVEVTQAHQSLYALALALTVAPLVLCICCATAPSTPTRHNTHYKPY